MCQPHRHAGFRPSSILTPSLTLVKLQTSPGIILVPSRLDESFVNSLQPSSAEDHIVSIRPKIEFSFEKARQKLLKLADVLPYAGRLSIELPDDVLGGDGGKSLRMGGVVEWNKQVSVTTSKDKSHTQIGCAGALITYLNKHEPMNKGDEATDAANGSIAGIESQSIGGGMYINSDTLRYILSQSIQI